MNDPEIAKQIAALKDRSRDIRLSAVLELGKRGDATCVPALVRTLRDPDDGIRSAAVEALVDLGAHAVRPLGKMLTIENGSVCRSIAAALVRIGVPAVPVLVEALRYDEAQY